MGRGRNRHEGCPDLPKERLVAGTLQPASFDPQPSGIPARFVYSGLFERILRLAKHMPWRWRQWLGNIFMADGGRTGWRREWATGAPHSQENATPPLGPP